MEANWVIEEFDPQLKAKGGDKWLRIFDDFREVARIPWDVPTGTRKEAEERAALIVRAVNERDDLIAALKGALAQLTGPAMVHGDGRGNDGKKTGLSHGEFCALQAQRIEAARAALARAEA